MFKKILIANRGEIACRVIKTAKKMGIATVAVYSDADRNALHVRMADEAVHIGPPPANQSYIVIDKIMDAIRRTGAEAVHPGYGFLSENMNFAAALEKEGVAFIGPPSPAIEAMGDKITSKKLAQEAGVSTVPGYMGLIADADEAVKISAEIGYPVMIKASAGGGGKGMRIVHERSEMLSSFNMASQEAERAFSDGSLYLEKFQVAPRHVEFQLMADRHGNVIHLGDRDCSLQRHHQKLLEETPCTALTAELRRQMGRTAIAAAKAVGYVGAGTVEFLLSQSGEYYFMEMNTRLQVEHPVTEAVTGADLVCEQIRIALGDKLSWKQKDIKLQGHAIEIRINAEDPKRNFSPCPGLVSNYLPPGGPGVRVDSHLYSGYVVPPYYDSMLAKIIVHGADRKQAIARSRSALRELRVEGVKTSAAFAEKLLEMPEFVSGEYHSASVEQKLPELLAQL